MPDLQRGMGVSFDQRGPAIGLVGDFDDHGFLVVLQHGQEFLLPRKAIMEIDNLQVILDTEASLRLFRGFLRHRGACEDLNASLPN